MSHNADRKKGGTPMTKGFQQQDPGLNFCIPKSAPAPQHGQKPDKVKATPVREPRSVQPRPGH
jgi:hypothetical protein